MPIICAKIIQNHASASHLICICLDFYLNKIEIEIEIDRGQEIRAAIKKYLPSNPILLCWNHLIGDFETWLRKNKFDSDNRAVYI